jgi:transposase InsO family protein
MYYSLSQVAQILQVTRQSIHQRKDLTHIKDCQDYEIRGKGGARHYPWYVFPDDIQIALGYEKTPQPLPQTTVPNATIESNVPTEAIDVSAIDCVDLPTPPVGHPSEEGICLPEPIELPTPQNVEHLELKLPIPAAPKKAAMCDSWIEIFRIRDAWCQERNFPNVTECDKQFAAAVTAGEIPEAKPHLPHVAWGKQPGISRTTLARQRQRFRDMGIAGYVRNTDKAVRSIIDGQPELQQWIINFAIKYPEAPIVRLYKEMAKNPPRPVGHPSEEGILPSLTTVRVWLKNWQADNHSLWLKMTAPDKWRNTYEVAYGTQNDTTAPNDKWELDSTIGDVMLEGGRHYVLALVDVFTRRALLLVSKSSKADAVLSLLRRAMVEWGIPTAIKTDNGSDYISNQVKRFCAQAEIHHEICTPGNPQGKPHVERFFGTFSHTLMPCLPGYTGHNVATAQAIRSRHQGKPIEPGMDATQFQFWCEEWLEDYNVHPHQGLDMKTSLQCWADAIESGWMPRQVSDIRQLDLLLASIGKRKVQKKGIKIDGYFYCEGAMSPYTGHWVWVSRDVSDMGRIYYFDESNNFLGEAICAELLGIGLREVALEGKRDQIADINEKKKDLKIATRNHKKYEKAAIEKAKTTTPIAVQLPANVVSIAAKQAEKQSKRDVDDIFPELAQLWLNGCPDVDLPYTEKELRNASARIADKTQTNSILSRVENVIPDQKMARYKFAPWLAALTDRLFPTKQQTS